MTTVQDITVRLSVQEARVIARHCSMLAELTGREALPDGTTHPLLTGAMKLEAMLIAHEVIDR